jgi:hypothetical protein
MISSCLPKVPISDPNWKGCEESQGLDKEAM